ncbi:MAG: ABC transporter substrate-binding protein [Candidatus Competibacteraceae bacterium]|nr:ABC transporter substrate-binding protein [Candidatus Competibacteraceae bacterium]
MQLRILAPILALGSLMTSPLPAASYDPGASDDEIKIGNTMPYSGPASAYGSIGKALSAYFDKINAEGGVNGRKINFISRDDGYSPPKTKEQYRKLVESEQVLLMFQSLGTPTNSAVHAYINRKKVPHLFVSTGAAKWSQPQQFPWTMGWQPNYQIEGRIYARYLLENVPDARIGILYQNDDYGKDYVKGLKDGLGAQATELIVAEESYEVTDPTISSQIITLKNQGANVFYNVATPKFAAQAIKKIAELDWQPVHLLNSVSNSVGAVLQPAGLANSQGIITAQYQKDPTDPSIQDDPGYKAWLQWMEQYYPDGDKLSRFNVYAYNVAQTLVHVLAQAGDDLTRENIMRQAANLQDIELPMLLDGVRMNTSPEDYNPIEAMQLQQFDGSSWRAISPVIDVGQ